MPVAPRSSLAPRRLPLAAGLGRIFHERAFGAIAGLLILAVTFEVMSGHFFSAGEARGLSLLAAQIGIVAIGVAFLMVSGEFDLSVASVFAFTPIVMGLLITDAGWPDIVAFTVALVIATAIGTAHGLIVTRLSVPSFITTLATLFVLEGTNYTITGGHPVGYFEETPLTNVLGGSILDTPFSAPFAWFLLLGTVFWFLLGRTQYGNWTSAAGGKIGVARTLGVPVHWVKTGNFAICSLLAGFAGTTAFAQLGSVDPGFGEDLHLLAIVAAVLGGTSLFGVQGSIVGTVFGALILGALATGLILVGAPGSIYTALIGVILLIAVLFNGNLKQLSVRLARAGQERRHDATS
jgi:simple sugar transport system permease protein